MKFVVDVGRVCSIHRDKVFCNLPCKRLQCDEILGFVGAKSEERE